MSDIEVPGEDGAFRNILVEFASESYPELFTGISKEITVVVHRVPSPGLPLDTAVRERFPELRLRFADTARNRIELDALVERVAGDRDYWRSKGIDIVMWGPHVIGGLARVGIMQSAEAAQAEFDDRYGPGAVEVIGDMQRGTFL